MAAAEQPVPEKTLQEVVDDLALYPIDAFQFVEEGLTFTVSQVHGHAPVSERSQEKRKMDRHITGAQLCEGLRQYALQKWGLLADTVLRRWNITCTYDFGRIVFALIDAGRMAKTDRDDMEDFRNIFDFKTAFDGDYRIEHTK